MKKFLAVLAASLLLASCGSSKTPDINIDNLAADLVADVSFTDDLALIDDSMISNLYNVQYEDAVLYMGSGATAEEVAIFACADEAAAKTALDGAKSHIQSQIDSFEDYIPEEVKRLEEALVLQEGKYVITVVTEDKETAQGVIDKYLEK